MGPPFASSQAAAAASARRHLLPAVLVLVMAAVLAGCGGSEESGGGAASPPTTAPATSATGGPATTEPAELADGRHPVYLKTVDPEQPAITFDLIQFFTGEAAAKAAAEDGQESPPPNDYYIRNVNPRLRTLPVQSGAPITVNVLAAQASGSSVKNVSVTLEELAGYFPNSGTAPFWITVEGRQVSRIAQQFVP